jgi:hypothetical protein
MRKALLLLILSAMLISSCTPTPAATELPVSPTVVEPTLTATNAPTDTTAPTMTLTASLVPTITVVHTPTPDYDVIRYVGASIVKGQLMLSFRMPDLNMPLKATVDGYAFNCTTDNRYPGTLYCLGRFFAGGQRVSVKFSVGDDPQVIKEVAVVIPLEAVPTPITPGPASNWCPLRGQNVTCDEEYDEDSGVGCLDVTCYDACGYYYSIHQCEPN